jgi:hypothetical protein
MPGGALRWAAPCRYYSGTGFVRIGSISRTTVHARSDGGSDGAKIRHGTGLTLYDTLPRDISESIVAKPSVTRQCTVLKPNGVQHGNGQKVLHGTCAIPSNRISSVRD